MSDVKPIQKKSERKAKRVETYGTYILKVLKAIESEDGKGQKDVGVSKRCMEAMNSLVNDLFERISTEASILARKSHRNTIGKKEIESAAKLVLNGGELFKSAQDFANDAVSKYSSDKQKKWFSVFVQNNYHIYKWKISLAKTCHCEYVRNRRSRDMRIRSSKYVPLWSQKILEAFTKIKGQLKEWNIWHNIS